MPARRLVRIEKENIPRGIILKVHALCNLACGYCYMYDEDGKLLRDRPGVMSDEVIRKVAMRIREYLDEHELSEMTVILHGGEPLLAGIDKIRYIVETLRSAIPDDCSLRFVMQTNATLVTSAIAQILKGLGVQVGASLDGDEQGNKNRPYRNHKSSYLRAVEGIQILKQHEILQRILSVIHLENDPVETAKNLLELHPYVDLLLPITKWEEEPSKRPSLLTTPTPYADWIIKFHGQWIDMGCPGDGIRTINILLRLVEAWSRQITFPHEERVEWVGPWIPGDLLVETDGKLELLDGLTKIKLGDSWTGLNIFDHRLTHGVVALLKASMERGIVEGSQICQSCKLFDVCGGGYHLHRHGPKNGYVNPSFYCADLQELILRIAKGYWDYATEDPEARKLLAFGSIEEALGIKQ